MERLKHSNCSQDNAKELMLSTVNGSNTSWVVISSNVLSLLRLDKTVSSTGDGGVGVALGLRCICVHGKWQDDWGSVASHMHQATDFCSPPHAVTINKSRSANAGLCQG